MKASWIGFMVCGWMVIAAGDVRGETPPPDTAGTAQQTPDSSAAVAADVNGFVTDESSAKFHGDYIARMVEQGTPELAYDQAQMLVIFDSGSALAWGVIAWGDAKRGEMADAITEIVLAARSLPGNAFIQSTAGDLFAWYDVKGRGVALDFYTLQGMVEAGGELDTHAGFVQAYAAARKAYESQGDSTLAPSTSQ